MVSGDHDTLPVVAVSQERALLLQAWAVGFLQEQGLHLVG